MGKRHAKLTEEQQVFIVEQLATYRTATEVIGDVAEAFDGVVVTKQQVQRYDVASPGGRCSKKLRARFASVRAEWQRQTAEEGVANQRYRLRDLQLQREILLEQIRVLRESDRPNRKLLAELLAEWREVLKQSAQETGDVFTNRHKFEGDPIAALAGLLGISPAELREAE